MLVSAIQHHESATGIHTSPPSWTFLPPPTHSTPLGWHRDQAELFVLYSKFPLATYFTYGNIYVSMFLSQFVPSSPSSTVSASVFSMSSSLLLPCKQVHQYHLSRFHIYVLIYNICFSLSGWLHSIRQALGSFTSVQLTHICSFLWLSNIPLYIFSLVLKMTKQVQEEVCQLNEKG